MNTIILYRIISFCTEKKSFSAVGSFLLHLFFFSLYQGAKSKRVIPESVTRCVTRCYITRGSFENLNTSKRIVWGEKYGRFVTINIAKYEHFTRKTIRIYPHFVCPL